MNKQKDIIMCVALFSYTYVLDKLTETKEQEIEKISRVLVDNQNDPFDALDQIINDSNIDQNTFFLNLIKPLYTNEYAIELALQAFLKLNYLDICTTIRKMIDSN